MSGLPFFDKLSLEEFSGVRHGARHDIRDRPLGHDGPAPFSALRAKIDDVVGAEDQVKIVFDHDHGVPPVKQLVRLGIIDQ
jgi:hypothetical protein